jgi:PAB-dependent poly(A)-specific ribonuclease subunit 3
LDAGDQEDVVLSSRDQQNLLIASFADVKRCLEEAFHEVVSSSSSYGGEEPY